MTGDTGTARAWSVFDGIQSFPASAAAADPEPDPHTLMSEIDASIATLEHAHATSLLRGTSSPSVASSSSSSSPSKNSAGNGEQQEHGTGLADEAYKSACAALAAGKLDAALKSLQVALVSCPPEKDSALSKIRSLIAYATQQQRFRDQHKKDHNST